MNFFYSFSTFLTLKKKKFKGVPCISLLVGAAPFRGQRVCLIVGLVGPAAQRETVGDLMAATFSRNECSRSGVGRGVGGWLGGDAMRANNIPKYRRTLTILKKGPGGFDFCEPR